MDDKISPYVVICYANHFHSKNSEGIFRVQILQNKYKTQISNSPLAGDELGFFVLALDFARPQPHFNSVTTPYYRNFRENLI